MAIILQYIQVSRCYIITWNWHNIVCQLYLKKMNDLPSISFWFCLVVSTSLLSLLICSYLWQLFFIRALNILIMMILNSLPDNFKICAVFCSLLGLSLFFFNKFIYFWLHWIFVAACGLYLVAASGGYSSLWCAGFTLRWLLLLWIMGSRHMGISSCGSRALEHRLSSCGARA